MDASDRLAALLAGELDAAERAALEAELARDPELRADLDAMERADAHLARLRSPVPTAGFEQRLDDRVAATLAEVLGDPGEPAADDVFTARRRDRASRRVQTLIGVAAAAVVVVGGGALLTSMSGDDTDDSSAMFETQSADDSVLEESDSAQDAGVSASGPVVVAEGRSLGEDDLDALLTGEELDLVASQNYDETLGRDVAGVYRSDLGAGPVDGGAGAEAGTEASDEDAVEDLPEQESTEDGESALSDDAATEDRPAGPEVVTREGAPLPAADAADIARCLDEVLSGGTDAIPAYAELATYEDTEVVVLGLVTLAPDTGTFSRNEVWVLDRATCQVVQFTQR